MTNLVTISELPSATTPLQGNELIPIVQNNQTVATNITQLLGNSLVNLSANGYIDVRGSGDQISILWEGAPYTTAAAFNSSNTAEFGALGTTTTVNCFGLVGYNSNTTGGVGTAGLGRYGVLGRALTGAVNSNGVRGEASATATSIGVYGGGNAANTYGVWAYGGTSGTALYSQGPVVFADAGNTVKGRVDELGNLIQTVNSTPPSLSIDKTLVLSLASDTSLRISVRGADGVTRTATIALS